MKISKQIITKRKELDITQKELANKLNVTDKTVSRWERGTTIPDVEMLKKLSVVIGLDLNEVFDGIEIEINDHEIINQESIKKYRVGFVSTTLLFIFASALFFMIKLMPNPNSDSISKVLFPLFFVLAILMIMIGTIIYSISLIRFHSSFSDKKYKSKYIREINVSIGVLIATIILIIVSLII